MSKSKDRTRIELSSLELDVGEDALAYYGHVLDDELRPDDKLALFEYMERRRALSRFLKKVDKARERISGTSNNQA